MSDQLVLVTGASGYVASHVVQQLQQAGYRVRGTVRSLSNESRVESLRKLVPDAKHALELVEADLGSDDGWSKAVEGCWAVLHVASPFPNVAEKKVKEEELIGPAKEGTTIVLKAASEAGVKKVVLTSSFASIFAEASPEEGKKYSEGDWSDPDSPTIDAYSKSKVLAEKAAWELLKNLPDEKKFDLSVINPVLVMGPTLLDSHKSSTSVSIMADMLNHKYPGVPSLMFAFCDVRDVAKAHLQALSTPEAVGKRHLISTGCYWMKDIAAILAKEFKPQGYRIFTNTFPYFMVWCMSFFNEGIKTSVLPRSGKLLNTDNSRMVSVLGITPTSIDDTIQDMAYALIDMGIVAKSKKYKQVGSRAEKTEVVPAAEAATEQEELVAKTEDMKVEELEPEDKESVKEESKTEEVKTE